MPDGAVSHGHSEPIGVQEPTDGLSSVTRTVTSEDASTKDARLTKQMSAVRNRPRPPVQRPLADHGEGPLTVVSDGSRSFRPMQPQQPVHASHRLPTTLVGDVGVDVHRDGDLRVTEDLHRDARRHTCGEQERGARVPGVVEPDHTEPGILGHARERREGFSTSSRALPPRQRGVARPGVRPAAPVFAPLRPGRRPARQGGGWMGESSPGGQSPVRADASGGGAQAPGWREPCATAGCVVVSVGGSHPACHRPRQSRADAVPGVQVVRTVARSTWTPGTTPAPRCVGRRQTGWELG